jgi:hypothetical protein
VPEITQVFLNGTVYPVEPAGRTYEALAVYGDRIAGLGTNDEIRSLVEKDTEVINLKGRFLMPGFIDTHAHLLDTGLTETRLNFAAVPSLRVILGQVKERADSLAPGAWVLGGNFDENFTAEKRLPTLAELDAAAGGHPLYINHRSYHWSLVNSAALALLGLPADLPGLERGADGQPTGLLNREANASAKVKLAQLVSTAELTAAFCAVSRRAAQVGLTTIHCIEGGEYWGDQYPDFILHARPQTFTPVLYFNTEDIGKIKERGLARMGGDILVDGSISNRSAAFLEPYSDQPTTRGRLYHTRAELLELIEAAHRAGIQIGFHAIGDAAIEEVLTAYETVLLRWPRPDHRHRIEHFGVPRAEHIAQARKLGLVLPVQPAFVYQKGATYLTRLGEERFSRAYPLRDLWAAGLLLGGGSDSLVSPLDPLFGIRAVVNAPRPSQRLTVEQALRLYTLNAAALAFEEKEKGSLTPGKRADLVVLSADPRLVPPAELERVKVTMTVFAGKVVYAGSEETA